MLGDDDAADSGFVVGLADGTGLAVGKAVGIAVGKAEGVGEAVGVGVGTAAGGTTFGVGALPWLWLLFPVWAAITAAVLELVREASMKPDFVAVTVTEMTLPRFDVVSV